MAELGEVSKDLRAPTLVEAERGEDEAREGGEATVGEGRGGGRMERRWWRGGVWVPVGEGKRFRWGLVWGWGRRGFKGFKGIDAR